MAWPISQSTPAKLITNTFPRRPTLSPVPRITPSVAIRRIRPAGRMRQIARQRVEAAALLALRTWTRKRSVVSPKLKSVVGMVMDRLARYPTSGQQRALQPT